MTKVPHFSSREREREREREGRGGEREGRERERGGGRGEERENLFLLTTFFGPHNLIMGEFFSSSILPQLQGRDPLLFLIIYMKKITQFGLVKINAVFR